MTNLIIAATKDEAAALRGQADSVVRTLDQADRRTLRGRTFDRLTFTADANAAATDEQRAAVLPCIAGESSGRP